MDDVDRLFQCFKCGISPPQSAFRERKKSKEKLNKVNLTQGGEGESSLFPQLSSPPSPTKRRRSPADGQLSTERVGKKEIKGVSFTRGNHISPVVFYGSPHGVPAKRPRRLLQLLREIHNDLSEENKLSSRRDIWVTFPKQDQAMGFVKKHPHAQLFSYQDHLNGQRRFLVSTYKEFWRRYKDLDSRFRHHYEVIREGIPCHLYFDLEFNKKFNVDKEGDEMVDILISVIFEILFDKYSIHGNEDWVVELDSSTEEKFSRHLVIHVPGTAFKDNSHAGAFVAECEEEMFMDSLICKMDGDCQKLLICKMDGDCMKKLYFDSEVNGNYGCHFDAPGLPFHASTTDVENTYFIGKSPFPGLDIFVESIASIGNVAGKIRSWYLFSEYGLMVYSMSQNRYCERIGRQHKSNNVMYIVDFKRAVYYQKCYDPDCKGFRSPFRPVPRDVIPEAMDFLTQPGYELGNNELDQQLYQNGYDHGISDSCKKDGWWLNAIKIADDIESGIRSLDHGKVQVPQQRMDDDEDYEWWMAVEMTTSQAEREINFPIGTEE